MSDTPETDHIENNLGNAAHPTLLFFCRKLERERDNALSDWRQADTDSIRALHERNEAREERDAAIAERDALAKALEECKEDSIELLGERDWWKDEPRCDYARRYRETRENITRADEILAIVKGISNE